MNGGPVAVFDSGLGGISILRQLKILMPAEDYLYFGDSLHAPYGTKSAQEITDLTRAALQQFRSENCKAMVIACNTATSAAVRTLREENPDFLIIGTEPAVKPAVEKYPGGRIVMMATEMTVREEKFRMLMERFRHSAEIIPVACSGLMEFVERGELEGARLEAYLREKLEGCLDPVPQAVVLGCTHYPFVSGAIRKVVGPEPEIMDGSLGVAMQAERKLRQRNLLKTEGTGTVEFRNSLCGPEVLDRSRLLFELPGFF